MEAGQNIKRKKRELKKKREIVYLQKEWTYKCVPVIFLYIVTGDRGSPQIPITCTLFCQARRQLSITPSIHISFSSKCLTIFFFDILCGVQAFQTHLRNPVYKSGFLYLRLFFFLIIRLRQYREYIIYYI